MTAVVCFAWSILIIVNFHSDFQKYIKSVGETDTVSETDTNETFQQAHAWLIQVMLFVMPVLIAEICLIIAVHCKLKQQYAGFEIHFKVFNRYTLTLLLVFVPQTVVMFFVMINKLILNENKLSRTAKDFTISTEVFLVGVLIIIRLSEPLVWHSLRETVFYFLGLKQ